MKFFFLILPKFKLMNLYSIETGNFKLDGGAMFSVVPRLLWEKTNPPDNKNRISMAARSLLIEDGGRLILVDTGIGNKQDEKFFSHYGLWGGLSLDRSLLENGFHRDDITDVFLTHLHFDHCGGSICIDSKGNYVPAFKNAKFWVHQNHWNWAKSSNIREKASFIPENINPIESSGQLNFIKNQGPYVKNSELGFDIILVDGHTEKQMLPVVKYKEKTIVFAADLIPTIGHIPVPYIMSYDTRPLITLKEKTSFLKSACQENWLLFMEHDPFNELISLKMTEKGVSFDQGSTLKEFF
ncbi:MAG: glyoxylase-like metal-dependent hydrolase (beta-lactamase superfamily II) [Candidatus Marivariicella framensis]|jgi:glyoxylase-like metal-dependent hydrolase (beta-lactamase superfamily II)|tara:strand:- start:1059 stop:1949 length:891 start_codon:yes stop_codon:yes gene_type:complete